MLLGNDVVRDKNYREKVYEIVREIPVGKVMTYGQIAAHLGAGYTPRTVGFVMFAASAENVPWQRVINSQGSCSTAKLTLPINLQQKQLEEEGVKFDEKGRCNLQLYRWLPEIKTDENEAQPSLFQG